MKRRESDRRSLPAHVGSIFAFGLLVAATVGVLAMQRSTAFDPLDRAILDTLSRHAPVATTGRTIVVDIDDLSLSAVGQWPWPRYRLASMIERIAAARPAAIGLDVLLPEADRSSLSSLRKTYKQDFGVDLAFSGVPEALTDNDGWLGDVMARSDVVGADFFYFDHVNLAPSAVKNALRIETGDATLSLPRASGILSNAPAIAGVTRTTGFVNQSSDDDGLLRRLPLLIAYDGVVHPSLPLATAMRALGVSSGTVETSRDGPLLRLGDHRVPIDETGAALLRFDGPARAYDAISAIDILQGRFEPADLADRIVFIGSSAIGLNDVHDTAVGARFPGLKIEAVMAGNIVDQRSVRVPSWSPAAGLAQCLVAGLVMSALFALVNAIPLVVGGGIVLVALLTASSLVAFERASLFVSPAAGLVVSALLFVVFLGARFAIEKQRSRTWRRQLENARQVTIESMASVAETRDPETGAHIKRTQHYVRAIAERLRGDGAHPGLLTKEYIDLLFLSAPLHDIGKVGVPDHILLKPGKLTPDEFVLMKQHAEFGRRIIFSTAERIDGDNFLRIAGEIAATHHEKWDGSGYPLGLAGEDIPLSGRIMAAADIYDALISRRCYKEPFSHEKALGLMRVERGRTFDPAVLDAFLATEAVIVAIAQRYRDDAEAALEPALTGHAMIDDPLPAAEALALTPA